MKKEVFNSTVIRLLSVTLIALNLAGCTAEWEQPGCRCADVLKRFRHLWRWQAVCSKLCTTHTIQGAKMIVSKVVRKGGFSFAGLAEWIKAAVLKTEDP